MIRNEQEYKAAVEKLKNEEKRLRDYQKELREEGLTAPQIKRLMDPLRSFAMQLEEEVAYYDKLKQGIFSPLDNFSGMGKLLVALRISKGVSQKDLADALGVDKSSVSRDEKNEYHGITVERVARILEALGVHLKTEVEFSPKSASSESEEVLV